MGSETAGSAAAARAASGVGLRADLATSAAGVAPTASCSETAAMAESIMLDTPYPFCPGANIGAPSAPSRGKAKVERD